MEIARPLTHDLVKNIFQELNARILRVEVISLRDDTFYGNIVVESNGQTLNIDSRPSDALALAVRAHVPILVAVSVMDSAGIIPEEDLQESDQDAPLARRESGAKEPEEADDRLSIFDDFLTNLDIEDDQANDEADDEDDDATSTGSSMPGEN